MIQKINNDNLGRALHNILYQRIVTFCQQYTPEYPADAVAKMWLQRLYTDDSTLIIIVDMDDKYNIVAHAVIEVQQLPDIGRVLICHQAQGEKNSSIALSIGAEYLDKLAVEYGATCAMMHIAKRSAVLEKKYGYTIARTVMVKHYGAESDAESE